MFRVIQYLIEKVSIMVIMTQEDLGVAAILDLLGLLEEFSQDSPISNSIPDY